MPPSLKPIRWAYGVTTVPSRVSQVLPDTLRSLASAGFPKPRLFVDGTDSGFGHFGLPLTYRDPAVRVAGNWWLALQELVVREPMAHRYLIFQDDLLAVSNLRQYMEHCPYPERAYLNLYTFPENQARCSPGHVGWYHSNQLGRSALGLCFDRVAAIELLGSRSMVQRPFDTGRGWRNIDGGISHAMRKLGFTEFVHNPSLLQHTGDISAMGNKAHPKAMSFPGADYDAMKILEGGPIPFVECPSPLSPAGDNGPSPIIPSDQPLPDQQPTESLS